MLQNSQPNRQTAMNNKGKNLQIINYINRPHLYTAASIKIEEKGEIVQGHSVLHVLVRFLSLSLKTVGEGGRGEE